MNETIAALIQALKEEEVYRQYNVCLQELNNHHELLAAYQKAKQEYIDMRPYFKYQDFSDLKARVQQRSSELTQLESYQDYMQSLHQLEARLEEITAQIFKDVFEQAEVKSCVSLPENINEEI